MNFRPDVKPAPRVSRGFRRASISALCLLAIAAPTVAVAETSSPSKAAAPETIRDFPKRLSITVVADEHLLSTFQQRVSSWFNDGTEVVVTVTSQVDEKQLLSSSPAQVSAWIVPLSSESALLTFSCVSPPAAPRHLVREVRLRSGFDELGLERLASVTHSAFVALSRGAEGVEREQAERELGAAGVAAGTFAAPGPPAAVPPSPAVPSAPPSAPARVDAPPPGRAAIPATEPRVALLVAAGYGVRLRGAEGVGQGPSVVFGAQVRGTRTALDLQLSGQYLFASEFDAAPFSATVQTTALRAQFGLEPQLKSSFYGQVLIGFGADIARVSAQANSSNGGASVVPADDGTQVRGMGELSLGIVRRGELLDVGLVAQMIFAFAQVRYSAMTGAGERPLVEPWPVQPALSIQGRFRSAL